MTLGLAPRQTDLFDDAKRFCDETVPANSIYALLHRDRAPATGGEEILEHLVGKQPVALSVQQCIDRIGQHSVVAERLIARPTRAETSLAVPRPIPFFRLFANE